MRKLLSVIIIMLLVMAASVALADTGARMTSSGSNASKLTARDYDEDEEIYDIVPTFNGVAVKADGSSTVTAYRNLNFGYKTGTNAGTKLPGTLTG